MLEREQRNETPAPTKVGTAQAAGPKLTPDELTELLNEAIRQTGHAEVRREQALGLTSLEDAVAIAREAGIPEQSVRAAADAMARRKMHGSRRELIRKRRGAGFFAWLGLAAGAGLAAALFGSWVGLAGTLLVMGIPALFLAWRWLFAPISDADAEATNAAPTLGVCQVCGRSAVNPGSTLCEEHTYRRQD